MISRPLGALGAAAMTAALAFGTTPGAAQGGRTAPPASSPLGEPPAPAAAGSPPGAPRAPAAPAAPTAPVTDARGSRDGAQLSLRAAAGSVEVGEPLRLTLEVTAPPGVEVRFDRFGSGTKGSLGDFEVRAARLLPVDPARPAVRAQELQVVSFASGMVTLPPIEVTLVNARGAERRTSVGPLAIEVRSLIGDADPREALRPVKDAVEIRFPRDWRILAAIGAGVLLLAVIGAFLWRALRRAGAVPPPPPHVLARNELAALRQEQLPGHGRVLEYYIRLSDIVRRYVEGRFGIRAPEQTTKEFLAAATHHPAMRDGHRSLLAGFLRSADRVKFAAERPGQGECDRAFDAANSFVDETVPQASQGAAAPPPPSTPVSSTGTAARATEVTAR